MNSFGNCCMCNCCDQTKKKLADLTGRLDRLEQREKSWKSLVGIQRRHVNTNVVRASYSRRFSSVLAEHVGVVGLKETIMWQHRPLKIIWALLLIVGAGATAYYIIENIIGYLGDNTATRVSFKPLSEYPFPPFVACPPWPINLNEALSTTGLSVDALNYSLILYKSKDGNGKDPDLSQLIELATYAKNNNYSNLDSAFEYYFSNISTSAIVDNEVASNNHTLTYKCQGCDGNQTQASKITFRGGICYLFKLSPLTNLEYIAQPSLKLVNKDDMGGLSPHTRTHWMFDILPNIGKDGPHMRLDPGAYAVTINSQSFEMLEGRKCQQAKSQNDEDVDPLESCRENCFSHIDNAMFDGFLVLAGSNETNFAGEVDADLVNITENFEQYSNGTKRPDTDHVEQYSVNRNETKLVNGMENVEEYSNETQSKFAQWLNLTRSIVAKINTSLSSETVKDCLLSCKPACNSRVYTVSIMKQESYEHENTNTSSVYLTFEHLAWRRGYVLVYEEFDTMTFSDFISNVGGTFGLFLGCTILTIAQFILTFCHYIFEKNQGNRH